MRYATYAALLGFMLYAPATAVTVMALLFLGNLVQALGYKWKGG